MTGVQTCALPISFDIRHLRREEAEYRLATRLACPSDFVVDTFVGKGFAREQLVRHRYGYDDSRLAAPEERALDPMRKFTACFVARCEPRKGLHHALEAWHRSGAATTGRFLIAGNFVAGYRELLAKWLDHPSIELVGFVDDIGVLMRQSDVFILPSIEEGSALVTYDARACGCVLLVSDATGAPCTHMTDALVHRTGDVETLTEHLRLVQSSPELLARLREQSLSGLENLTWKAATRDLICVYEDVVARHRLGTGGAAHVNGSPAERASRA